MLTLPPSVRIYLAVEPIDLRRGHDGLSAVVRGQWRMDLFAGHLFVFLRRPSMHLLREARRTDNAVSSEVANDNAAASEVEAAESESPLGLATGAAVTGLGIFASQVQGLAQEMFEQQDADANAVAKAAAQDEAVPTPDTSGNDPTEDAKEHTKNPRPSSLPKHEKGQKRKQTDAGGEKGDCNRRLPRKRPPPSLNL